MKFDSFFIAMSIAVTLLAIGVSPLIVVPRVERSIFRYRLWRIRDKVVDDVLSGELPEAEAVTKLISRIETMIRHAERLTYLTVKSAGAMMSTSERARIQEERELSVFELSIGDRKRMSNYERQTAHVLQIYLAKGSVLGWFATVGISLRLALRRLFGIGDSVRIEVTIRQAVIRALPPHDASDVARALHRDKDDRRDDEKPTAAYV